MTISAIDTRGRWTILPPNGALGAREAASPAATHCGHRNPTAAGVMQSGQIVRSHRAHRM
jgi:hypothetical protein